MTNPSNVLEQLYMDGTKLSSNAAVDLFTALKDNSKLQQLYIEENEITDNALHAITTGTVVWLNWVCGETRLAVKPQ